MHPHMLAAYGRLYMAIWLVAVSFVALIPAALFYWSLMQVGRVII